MSLMKDENQVSALRQKYPTLTHTSYGLFSTLKPHENVDKTHQYQGKIVCATSGHLDREFYALRCNQRIGMINRSIPFIDGMGENRIFIFEKIKDEYYEYTVSSKNFIPVTDDNEKFTGEWISKTPVKPLSVRHGTREDIISKTSAGIYLIQDLDAFYKILGDHQLREKMKNPRLALSVVQELVKQHILRQVKAPFYRPSPEKIRHSND